MRILHTSDWHIGRTFHGHSTLDALRGVLDELTSQVRAHGVDVVVVAGDVFDSATPAAACYTLLSDALRGIADAGAHVVVTSGNHDSAARLGFQAGLLRDGIHVLTNPDAVGTPLTIDDAHGPVHFYGIPYLEPALLRHRWEGVRTQAAVLGHAMDLVRDDLAARGGRSVAIAHCFAAGVEPTPHLERDIQQGGLDVVPLSTFDGVDYMALGHIHGRQQLSERVRYAGAPLHYSFGEGDKPRGSWLVELDADGLASVDWIPLPVPRRLVTLRGPFADVLADAAHAVHEDAWVCVEYTDDLPESDPLRRLQQRFAFCAKVVHAPSATGADEVSSYAQRVRAAKTDRELVDAFLSHVRAGQGLSEREEELVDELLDDRVRLEALA
ncbi:exonuclease SbcCD subunit D [Microbacterium sp. EYE_5]|uniref:exonuclease SbcCD subunit D n=1 Tax=unclassified Microbacterium TaxID=2609290 RepID=UPI0020051B30|nr:MULTISPECIES: exonuclease SbcCD subunit D [unclassified Microbacterium]MCK6080112.1 exonuclease SbcCD subunit D [Microbacterium sp. EYE_382]MCK6085383.1 exonuclease SbcCD subunit D [Microbacterium sp. EYE_384]MCK6122392.1 exonuclease SbcCD subunit D [Microbacterium sp. EYE_80]MCK6126146.1 exonuclease SbcCD subunit D [Microbacterium sp. EYE_79]MCK6141067.1 exonuclease SbcCD subunit D [Microbacterium sp. EYE_39]